MGSSDSWLPWVAAIGGVFAALGGFLAAIFTGWGSAAARAQLELESKPVLVLTSELSTLRDFHETGERPPSNVFFLNPEGSLLVELRPAIKVMTPDGHLYVLPEFFQTLTLTNAGRLPLVDVALTGRADFFDETTATVPSKTEPFTLRLPYLAAGAKFTFAVANVEKPATFAFDPKASVTRIDTEKRTDVSLFMNESMSQLHSSSPMPPVVLPLVPDERAKPPR